MLHTGINGRVQLREHMALVRSNEQHFRTHLVHCLFRLIDKSIIRLSIRAGIIHRASKCAALMQRRLKYWDAAVFSWLKTKLAMTHHGGDNIVRGPRHKAIGEQTKYGVVLQECQRTHQHSVGGIFAPSSMHCSEPKNPPVAWYSVPTTCRSQAIWYARRLES